MTISYHLDVQSASVLAFFRLLFRWKASIWKIVLREMLIWTFLYLLISFFYRTDYFLSAEQKVTFEELAHYLKTHLSYIPLTFILGFFVNTIVSRWSDIFYNIGYVESQAIFVGNYVQGKDRETTLLRRAMARYMCLTQALVFRDISIRVRRRFPTYESLVKAGFLTEDESEKLQSIKLQYDKYWAPTNWIYTLIFRARREGKISHDILASKLCDEIKAFRYNLQMVCNYDWVPLPLVYPQAVFLAVYAYFGVCLIARQIIITERDAPNKSRLDTLLPIMTMVEFFFFIGWVKVAQGLLNPFGLDDDDFECNYLLDKNLATSLCIVDDQHDSVPEIKPDRFWRYGQTGLPRLASVGSTSTTPHPLSGSATGIKLDTQGKPTEMVVRTSEQSKEGDMGRRMSRAFSQMSDNIRKFSRRHTLMSRDRIKPRSSSPNSIQLKERLATINRSRTTDRPIIENFTSDESSLTRDNKEKWRRASLLPSMQLFTVENEMQELERRKSSKGNEYVPPDPSPSPQNK